MVVRRLGLDPLYPGFQADEELLLATKPHIRANIFLMQQTVAKTYWQENDRRYPAIACE